MKRSEIFVRILHEATGRPVAELSSMLEAFRSGYGNEDGFDQELSDTEAANLLAALRREKAGIVAWLVRGAGMDTGKKGVAKIAAGCRGAVRRGNSPR